MTGQLSSSSDITFKEGKIKAEKRARTPFFAYQKRKKKEKKKTTMSRYGTADKANYKTSTFSWDGHQFTAMNPDFFKKERKKVRQMTYGEAADYLMQTSKWSLVFRETGWERKETRGIVSYILDRSSVDYFRMAKEYCDAIDRTVITISRDGTEIVYRRYMAAVVRHDDGKVEEIDPTIAECDGDEAISELTGGLWDVLAKE